MSFSLQSILSSSPGSERQSHRPERGREQTQIPPTSTSATLSMHRQSAPSTSTSASLSTTQNIQYNSTPQARSYAYPYSISLSQFHTYSQNPHNHIFPLRSPQSHDLQQHAQQDAQQSAICNLHAIGNLDSHHYSDHYRPPPPFHPRHSDLLTLPNPPSPNERSLPRLTDISVGPGRQEQGLPPVWRDTQPFVTLDDDADDSDSELFIESEDALAGASFTESDFDTASSEAGTDTAEIEQNPWAQLGNESTTVSAFSSPGHHPLDKNSVSIQHLSHNPMPPARTRKRSIAEISDDGEPSTVATKRTRRRNSDIKAAPKTPSPPNKTRSIEEIDLVADEDDDALATALQRQRADAVQAQQQNPDGRRSKLSSLQCTVCLDAIEDLTATACGHIFCRACLTNWLLAGEKEAQRRPNCPACRKTLRRTSRLDIINVEIMKKRKK